MKAAIAAVTAIGLALLLVLGGAFGVAAVTPCGAGLIDPARAATLDPIDSYSGDQLGIAAKILNTVIQTGTDPRAAVIAVTAAITLSELRNLDTPERAGIYQQDPAVGSVAARLDPTTATAIFLNDLVTVADWLALPPGKVIHAIDPTRALEEYQANYGAAARITQSLQAAVPVCAIDDDPTALAAELAAAADDGRLRGLVPDHIIEIRWIAQGRTLPGCGIDTRILQIITIAVRNFDHVTVSDINRQCTGQILGAGTASSHWVRGGGLAVDFATLNHVALTGADANSLRLIALLDSVVPDRSRVGQLRCRADAGIRLQLANLTEFPDGCNHLHVDVAYAGDEPLTR